MIWLLCWMFCNWKNYSIVSVLPVADPGCSRSEILSSLRSPSTKRNHILFGQPSARADFLVTRNRKLGIMVTLNVRLMLRWHTTQTNAYSRDHQNSYNSFWGGHECLKDICTKFHANPVNSCWDISVMNQQTTISIRQLTQQAKLLCV